MMMLPPREIENKITIKNKEIVVKDEVNLTVEERVIFEKYRKEFKEAFENRFK